MLFFPPLEWKTTPWGGCSPWKQISISSLYFRLMPTLQVMKNRKEVTLVPSGNTIPGPVLALWLSVFILSYSWGFWNWQSQIIWNLWLLTEQLHAASINQPLSAELNQICASNPNSHAKGRAWVSSPICNPNHPLHYSALLPRHVKDKLEQLLVLQPSRIFEALHISNVLAPQRCHMLSQTISFCSLRACGMVELLHIPFRWKQRFLYLDEGSNISEMQTNRECILRFSTQLPGFHLG